MNAQAEPIKIHAMPTIQLWGPSKLQVKLVALICAASSGAAVANPGQDSIDQWRARIEQARLASIPPPPKGVSDLQWAQLSPTGWNPRTILKKLRVNTMHDADPSAAATIGEIREAWNQAPTVSSFDGKKVRLTGYPVVLDDAVGAIRTIVLVPYYGACVHRPAPPANQMILVSLARDLPKDFGHNPIWITGELASQSTPTPYGQAGYLVVNARWERYPIDKFVVPQYQWPH